MLVVLVVSERSQCLPYNAERQARQPLVPFLTPLVWRSRVSNLRPPASEGDALPLELSGPVLFDVQDAPFYDSDIL